MTEKTVLVHKQDKIATLVLNRPRVMNAMNPEMIEALQQALDQIRTDAGIHVVVVKGAGDNFCSGADFNLFTQEISSIQWLAGMKRIGKVITTLREIPQPVVSLLRGVAVGGGANLALAGDFVITADDARFSEVFIHIGLILDAGGTYFLPRLVGMAKARELAMLGEEFDGKTAASIGLVYKSVPEKELDAAVDALANTLAQKPLAAMALIKQGLDGSYDKSLTEILDWEAAHQSVMLQTPEHKSIVQLFLDAKKKSNGQLE
jgi:enoyl-CoA hydratase/2-(1,2-epoxy-1,2-dihydrophenyl)acetyl-CoA isomerase